VGMMEKIPICKTSFMNDDVPLSRRMNPNQISKHISWLKGTFASTNQPLWFSNSKELI
jgi:hypothetical protein